MDYDRLPVTQLLRGPVLHTPQGWVVLASVALYAGLALLAALIGVSPVLAKTPGAFFVVCVSWPLITFLMYVRSNAPSFSPSLSGAVHVAIVALCPIAYAGWRFYAA